MCYFVIYAIAINTLILEHTIDLLGDKFSLFRLLTNITYPTIYQNVRNYIQDIFN